MLFHSLQGAGGYVLPPSFNYLSFYTLATSSSTFNFTNCDFGTATANKIVVVCVSWNGGATGILLNSATINGTLATILQTTYAAGWERSCIIYASVSSTSGTVSLTFSGNVANGVTISTYSVVNASYNSAAYYASNSFSSTYTTTVTTNTNDVVISAFSTGSGGSNSWANITSNYYITTDSNSSRRSSASTQRTASGSVSISITGSMYGVLTTAIFR